MKRSHTVSVKRWLSLISIQYRWSTSGNTIINRRKGKRILGGECIPRSLSTMNNDGQIMAPNRTCESAIKPTTKWSKSIAYFKNASQSLLWDFLNSSTCWSHFEYRIWWCCTFACKVLCSSYAPSYHMPKRKKRRAARRRLKLKTKVKRKLRKGAKKAKRRVGKSLVRIGRKLSK